MSAPTATMAVSFTKTGAASVPIAIPDAWSRMAVRAIVAICALALLASSGLASSAPAAATTDLAAQISSARASQTYYESLMRARDSEIHSIKRQIKATGRSIRQAVRTVKLQKRYLANARAIVAERRARLARLQSLYSDPSADTAYYDAKLAAVRRDLRRAENRRAYLGKRLRSAIRSVKSRRSRLWSLRRQRGAAVTRREAAEAALGAQIIHMTNLAGLRVENQSSASLGPGGGSFAWPAVGRISQTYGCTGFRLNPRRGSCRHFHDGLDIVAGYGSDVQTAAVGVVAYTGWNPWDEGGRAWIIVVRHPDGYVTRYGHMLPTEKVRVGEYVTKGQVIGKMGNTGRSTGTHLHFELLRNGSDVNPLGYLPAGMVKHVPPKKAKGRLPGQRKAAGQSSAKPGAASEAAAIELAATEPAPGQPTSRCDAAATGSAPGVSPGPGLYGAEPVETLDPAPCTGPASEPVAGDVTPAVTSLAPPKPISPATRAVGVRLPLRGTSPAPA